MVYKFLSEKILDRFEKYFRANEELTDLKNYNETLRHNCTDHEMDETCELLKFNTLKVQEPKLQEVRNLQNKIIFDLEDLIIRLKR